MGPEFVVEFGEIMTANETDDCMASVARPATQARIKAFMDLGFHQPGDVEDRLGYYLAQLNGK